MTSSPSFIGMTAAAAWFCVFAVLHLGGLHAGIGNIRWLLTSYAVSWLGMLATTIGLLAGHHEALSIVLAAIMSVMTSACLLIMYMPAIYVFLTSISVQTLTLLRRSGGTRPEADLYEHFASRQILADRLETLADSGYLSAHGTHFRLTPRGRAVAKAFASIKAFWNLGPGG